MYLHPTKGYKGKNTYKTKANKRSKYKFKNVIKITKIENRPIFNFKMK